MAYTPELLERAVADTVGAYGDKNPAALATKVMPTIWLFEHADFQGRAFLTSLSWKSLGNMNDKFSSAIIVSGEFEFFVDEQFQGASSRKGPGYYPNAGAMGIPNDSLSSFKAWIT